MKTYRENDTLTLTRSVGGMIIGKQIKCILPIGTVATVVLVYGETKKPLAYEIEAYIAERDAYALATVEADDI